MPKTTQEILGDDYDLWGRRTKLKKFRKQKWYSEAELKQIKKELEDNIKVPISGRYEGQFVINHKEFEEIFKKRGVRK